MWPGVVYAVRPVEFKVLVKTWAERLGGRTDQDPTSTRVPIRCKQTVERSDEVHPSSVLVLLSECVDLRSILDETKTVAEPLDGAARYGDCKWEPWSETCSIK